MQSHGERHPTVLHHDAPADEEQNSSLMDSISQPVVQHGMPCSPINPPTDLHHPKTWRDRIQPVHIPHFHEYEDIDLSQPAPGTFRFPNDRQENGERTPQKDLHKRPDILPPSNAPFFSQIQLFSQRWAVWAATIHDDRRRKEVLQWISNKMLDAWKFGIENGHYDFGPFEAAEKERLLKENRGNKRQIDIGKKPAPFVIDNDHIKDYNIVNIELEKHEITMEMINRRIEDGSLQNGEELLQIMTARVQRELDVTHWRQNNRMPFKAGTHDRNLFMYSLWEVQRCRKTINILKKRLDGASNLTQRKSWGARIETLSTRSMQHLALAIELDLRDPIDRSASTIEDDLQDEMETETVETCPSPPEMLNAHVHKERVADGKSSNEYETSLSNCPVVAMEDSTQVPEIEIPELPELPDMPDLMEIPPELSFKPMLDLSQNKKRSYDEGKIDQVQAFKKQKTLDQMLPQQRPSFAPPFLHDSTLAANKTIDPRRLARAHMLPAQEDQDVQVSTISSAADQLSLHDVDEVEVVKRGYLAEVWQPRMDQLLCERSQRRLTWQLRKWSDVKNILEHLNFPPAQRNEYLREYKSGLAARLPNSNAISGVVPSSYPYAYQPQHQIRSDRPQHTKLTLKIPNPPSSSDEFDRIIHETRGFSFRSLAESSAEQRARLDDLVNDYVTHVRARRIRRHGTYIIMHDPQHSQRMPIAHGVWNCKNDTPVEDMQWFYAGEPIPNDLDVVAYHINDFEAPAPKTPSRPTRKTKEPSHATRGRQVRHARRPDRQARPTSYYAEDMLGLDDPRDDDYNPRQ